jgi:hypothetical protein
MATGWPMKVSYANGDVYSASDVNDTNGTINLLGSSVAYAAGKNKIINGDFYVNQRNFTSNTTDESFNFDRWFQSNAGGTVTVTPQTFALGTAPVAGYEGKNYARIITATQTLSSSYAQFRQRIEDVRTFAGQTVTLSFWAKASTGTPKIAPMLAQVFGTGGSPSANVNTTGSSVTLSTSWARYTATIAVPSISGKTLGTTNNNYLGVTLWLSAGSDYNSLTNSLGLQNATIDIWGVQLESGSTATAFQTATGTIQGELAACQRYYYRNTPGLAYGSHDATVMSNTATTAQIIYNLPVTMRIIPTSIDFANLAAFNTSNVYALSALAIVASQCGFNSVYMSCTSSGLSTSFASYFLLNNNNSAGYFGVSAEL